MNNLLKIKNKLNELPIISLNELLVNSFICLSINLFKNIRDDFAATPNPFNQNLNYEKILRFSITKVRTFFILPNIFIKKIILLQLNNVNGNKINF
jgi:hypothetical protein